MDPAGIELEGLTWFDVERYLERDSRLVIVLGATEEHAYLSLATDTLLGMHIARRACAETGVLLAPGLPYGDSLLLQGYPGTLTLMPETYARVVADLARSAHASGFRRLFFLNAHGGNNFVVMHIQQVVAEHPDLICDFFEWASEPAVTELAMELQGEPVGHANWAENTSFTRLEHTPIPDEPLPATPLAGGLMMLPPGELRHRSASGMIGSVYSAPDADVDRLMDVAVAAAVARLRALAEEPRGA